MFRGLALAGKFAFILYLARHFSLEDLGRFGLLASLVMFGIQLIGLDYYVFNSRRILGTLDPHERTCLIHEQLRFHALSYFIALPLFLVLLVSDLIGLNWGLALIIIAIIVAEHISQESSRLLTTLSRAPEANVIFFARTALWMLAFMLVASLNHKLHGFSSLITFWIGGAFLAMALAITRVWKLFDWKIGGNCPKRRWKSLAKQTRKAMPFFTATASLQVIEVSDRLMIDYFIGSAKVGIYVFSQNIASLLQTAATIGLITVIAPGIIEAFGQAKKKTYNDTYRIMVLLVLALLMLATPILLSLFPWLAELSGKADLSNSSGLFMLVLFGYVLAILSMLPYYSLYVRGSDWPIAWISIGAAVANLALNTLLIPRYELMGAAWATIGAFIIMFGGRLILAYWRSHS